MSSVDNRTVKMHWDGADFDKACENSKQILMQMQQTLDVINGKVASINVDGLNSAADSVVNKFSWMGTMIDQILRNIADKALEVGKNIASALTIDPMKSGFDEYQTMMDTMRVISNNLNMGKKLVIDTDALNSEEFQQQLASGGQASLFGTYAKFEEREKISMETIEGYLNELNRYADRTIYNFQNMTSAIARLINAGVDNLDDAVAAIQGLSNLSALSGATAEQNDRAMFNLGQVLSTGFLGRIDYMQFTKTQGLGKILNDSLVQAAADLGRFDVELAEHVVKDWEKEWKKTNEYKARKKELEKQYKDQGMIPPDELGIMPTEEWAKMKFGNDVYIQNGQIMRMQRDNVQTFSNNQGKTKTAEEILQMIADSNGNLNEVAQYKVFDSEVVLRALSMFSDETTELGQAAFKAATEVRSLKQLKDVIAEGLGSGWTNTWRYIIGEDPDEATAIWTGLYNVINPVIDETAQARNEMFKFWHDQGGRKAVLKGIGAAFEYMTNFIKPLKEHWDSKSAWAQLTSEERGKVLKRYSNEFRRWAMHLENLQWRTNALKNVLDLLHTPLDWIGSFFEHGGGYTILSSIGKIRDILLKVANLEAKAITRLFSDNDPGELLANWAGVFDAFLGHITERLKEGKDGLNKILFDFFQAAMRPLKWIIDSLQRVRLDDLLNILTDAFDIAVSLIEAVTAGFNQATDNIDVDKLAEYVSWIAAAVERWRQFFASSKGMALVTSAAEAFFSFFRMGLDLVIAKGMLIVDIVEQIAEAAKPFVTKYLTPVFNILAPIFRYVGKIALAFEKWVRESGIVKRVFSGLFDGLGKTIDFAIDKVNKLLKLLGIDLKLPTLDGEAFFDPKVLIGDPEKWVPMVMDNIIKTFEHVGSKLKDIPKLLSGEIKWEDFVRELIPPKKDGSDSILTTFLIGDFDKLKKDLSGTENFFTKFLASVIDKLQDIKKVFGGEMKFSELFFGEGGTLLDTLKSKLDSIKESLKASGSENGFLGKIISVFQSISDRAIEISGADGNGGVLALIKAAFEKLVEHISSLADSIIGENGFFASIKNGAEKLVNDLTGENGIFGGLFGKLFGNGGSEAGKEAVEKTGMLDKLKQNISGFLEEVSGFLIGDTNTAKLLDKTKDTFLLTQVGSIFLNLTKGFSGFGKGIKLFGKALNRDVKKNDKFFASFRLSFAGISEFFNELSMKFPKRLNKSMKVLTKGFNKFLKSEANLRNAQAFKEGSKGFVAVSLGILGIVAAIWLLAKVPEDKLVVAGSMIAGIALAIAAVALAFSKLQKPVKGLVDSKIDKKLIPAMDRISKGVKSFLSKAGLATMLIGFAIALGAVTKAVVKLGKLKYSELASGLVGVGAAIAMITASMVVMSNFAKTDFSSGIGNLLTAIGLSIAVGTLAKSVIKLSKIDQNALSSATVSLSALMTFFTLMEGGAFFTSGTDVFPILALTLAVIGMVNAVKKLAKLDQEALATASACLEKLMACFALMEFAAGQLSSGVALAGIVLMGVLLAEMAVVLWKLSELPNTDEMLTVATSLEKVLNSLSIAFGVCATIGEFAKGKSVLKGIGLFDAFIVNCVTLFEGIGGLFNLLDLIFGEGASMAGLEKAEEILVKTGEIIGEFVGSILGSIAELTIKNVGEGIEAFGTSLSNFYTNAATFLNGMASLGETKALEALGSFADAILKLTAADLIDKLNIFSNKDNPYSKFATGLSELAQPIADFANTVGSVGEDKVESAAHAAELLSAFATNLPDTGGALSAIFGDNDLGTFAEGLEKFVGPFGNFLTTIGNIEFEKEVGDKIVNMAANVETAMGLATKISEFADTVPNTGGKLAEFLGDNDLGTFGEQLGSFTEPFVNYLETVSAANYDEAAVEKSNALVSAIIGWAKDIPNSGGAITWFTGDNDIAEFASKLATSATDFVKYSTAIKDFDTETVEKTNGLINTIISFANAVPDNKEGSLLGVLLGNNSIDDFGYDLQQFGYWLARYSTLISDIKPSNMKKVEPCIDALITMSNKLPDLGGLVSGLIGDQSFETFGNNLVTLGNGLQQYAENTKTIDTDKVTAANDVVSALVDMNEKLPNLGGLFSVFTGDQSLGNFGSELKDFGTYLKEYGTAVANLNTAKMKEASESVDSIVSILNTAQSVSGTVPQDAISAISNAQWFVTEFVKEIEKGLNDETTTKPTIESAAETMYGYIVNGLNAGYYNNSETFTGKGETIANDFINTFTKAIDEDTSMNSTLYGAIDTVMTEAYKRVDNEYENYKGLGSHLVSGIVIGVNTKSVDLYTCMHNLAVNAYNEAANALQVRSPSRKFMQLGEYLDLGLINGINKRADEVDRSIVSSLTTPLKTLDALLSGDIDYQPVISPMLDLSMVKAGAGQLNGFFSDRTIRLAEINDEIQNQQKIARAQMDETSSYNDSNVISAINGLNESMYSVQDAISKMGITLDDGTLVGRIAPRIDRSIGRSKVMARRGKL